MQAYGMHGPVHNKRSPCHIPASLKEGDEEHHGKNHRDKHYDKPNPCDNPVGCKRDCPFRRMNETKYCLSPSLKWSRCHGIYPIGKWCGKIEGELKNNPHGSKEYRNAQKSVQNDFINFLCHLHFPEFRLF